MAVTFRGTTLKGYFEADQKNTKWQSFEFPNSDSNRVFFHGRGLGIMRFKGFAETVSEWNTVRDLMTDGVSGTLTYKASRADGAPDHEMTAFARLRNSKPFGPGWEYTVEFLAEDQVPKDGTGSDVY